MLCGAGGGGTRLCRDLLRPAPAYYAAATSEVHCPLNIMAVIRLSSKLLVTSALLLVTSALLLVTISY